MELGLRTFAALARVLSPYLLVLFDRRVLYLSCSDALLFAVAYKEVCSRTANAKRACKIPCVRMDLSNDESGFGRDNIFYVVLEQDL